MADWGSFLQGFLQTGGGNAIGGAINNQFFPKKKDPLEELLNPQNIQLLQAIDQMNNPLFENAYIDKNREQLNQALNYRPPSMGGTPSSMAQQNTDFIKGQIFNSPQVETSPPSWRGMDDLSEIDKWLQNIAKAGGDVSPFIEQVNSKFQANLDPETYSIFAPEQETVTGLYGDKQETFKKLSDLYSQEGFTDEKLQQALANEKINPFGLDAELFTPFGYTQQLEEKQPDLVKARKDYRDLVTGDNAFSPESALQSVNQTYNTNFTLEDMQFQEKPKEPSNPWDLIDDMLSGDGVITQREAEIFEGQMGEPHTNYYSPDTKEKIYEPSDLINNYLAGDGVITPTESQDFQSKVGQPLDLFYSPQKKQTEGMATYDKQAQYNKNRNMGMGPGRASQDLDIRDPNQFEQAYQNTIKVEEETGYNPQNLISDYLTGDKYITDYEKQDFEDKIGQPLDLFYQPQEEPMDGVDALGQVANYKNRFPSRQQASNVINQLDGKAKEMAMALGIDYFVEGSSYILPFKDYIDRIQDIREVSGNNKELAQRLLDELKANHTGDDKVWNTTVEDVMSGKATDMAAKQGRLIDRIVEDNLPVPTVYNQGDYGLTKQQVLDTLEKHALQRAVDEAMDNWETDITFQYQDKEEKVQAKEKYRQNAIESAKENIKSYVNRYFNLGEWRDDYIGQEETDPPGVTKTSVDELAQNLLEAVAQNDKYDIKDKDYIVNEYLIGKKKYPPEIAAKIYNKMLEMNGGVEDDSFSWGDLFNIPENNTIEQSTPDYQQPISDDWKNYFYTPMGKVENPPKGSFEPANNVTGNKNIIEYLMKLLTTNPEMATPPYLKGPGNWQDNHYTPWGKVQFP